MKERELSNIQQHERAWQKKKKHAMLKRVIGLDTETTNGKAFIIAHHDGKEWYKHRVKSFEDFLGYQQAHELYDKDNFFYNLGYDYQALIKHLSDEDLDLLAAHNRLDKEEYTIEIIPDKQLKITVGKKKYLYYDLAQFYGHKPMSDVGKEFFGEGKKTLGAVDIKNLSPRRYDYDDEYRALIDAYLEQDVKLCQRLGQRLQDLMRPYINPKYYYSQASPAQQYYLENATRDIKPPPSPVLQAALRAYNGGRFEVFKRGTYTHAVTYDIKSAYPYHNSNVPAWDKGSWTKDDRYHAEEELGLYHVRATGKSHISPLRHETKEGLLYYPVGRKSLWVNHAEYDVIKDYGYDLDILEAYHYHDERPEYPFLFLKEFYEQKERVGKTSPDYMFYKLVLNGFYGKTIQLEPESYLSDEAAGAVEDVILNKKLAYKHVRYKAGLLFNPVVAQEITGNTRAQLLRASIDVQDSVISFATDSITTMRRPKLRLGKELGAWGVEEQGRFTSVGSGVYFYDHQRRMKFRGFGKSYDPREVLVGNDDKVQLKVLRNHKLKKLARSGQGYEQLNVLEEDTKTLDLNFDHKRRWLGRFRRASDVYDERIESEPHEVTIP